MYSLRRKFYDSGPMPAPGYAWYLFDTRSVSLDEIQQSLDEADDQATGRKVYCRYCRNPVTHESCAISIDGREIFRRTNPAGIDYTFRCFSEAPGSAICGHPVSEHSWFTGCRWQIVICGSCIEHLGWYFTGPDSFFGLITERLVYEGQ